MVGLETRLSLTSFRTVETARIIVRFLMSAFRFSDPGERDRSGSDSAFGAGLGFASALTLMIRSCRPSPHP